VILQWNAPRVSFANSHTIAGNPAHRSHLLSGQDRSHYYSGSGYVPPHLYGSEGHEDRQGTGVPSGPAQGSPRCSGISALIRTHCLSRARCGISPD
jgi:hypothetical protein